MTPPTGRLRKALMVGGSWQLAKDDLADAVAILQRGSLLVYPTETLYGLGADPDNPEAVNRMYGAKGRGAREPVAVAVSSLVEARSLAHFTPRDLKIWRAFMPGPLTMVLKAKPPAPSSVVSERGALGVRMPRHEVALALLREFGPMTATSANLHGAPPPQTVIEAVTQLGNKVAMYIDGGPCPIGQGSTVVDLTGKRITVKREGAVGREELERHG